MSLVDELTRAARSRTAARMEVPGSQRHLLLLDRRCGAALGITSLDSADAVASAAPALDAIEREIPEAIQGRRTSVEVLEVAVDELGAEALAARVTSLQLRPERLGDALHTIRGRTLVEAAELDGWKGATVLVDRATGALKTITFWDSDDALRRSEIRETQLWIRVIAALGGSIPSVDRYEVAIDEAASAEVPAEARLSAHAR